MQQPSNILDIITQILFMAFLLMAFTGADARLRMYIWAKNIRMKMEEIKSYAEESEKETMDVLKKLNVRNAEETVKRLKDFFHINPVDIEPTDITKRMAHIIRTGQERWEKLIGENMPEDVPKAQRHNALVLVEITNSLNTIYKIVRHYLLTSLKNNNFFLMMQLWMIMPMITKVSKTLRQAVDTFKNCRPVGDSVGPLVAFRLLRNKKRLWRPAKDTVAGEVEVEGRRVIVVKAEGPGATVGNPGEAIQKVVEELGGNADLILTVDAALKLEGEETGDIAEGSGAAIGDPGPEKIAIERVATKYGIPLEAIVIKMSAEEAITDMPESVAKAADEAVKRVIERIKELPEGGTAIVAGIGNTCGVAQ